MIDYEPKLDRGYHPWLHWLAVATCCATFPLIFMGGLVTSHQAGMSVPDWPNSYGYNMFLFPPRLWVGGILYEHTHRLMGTVVGFLSICLVIAAWKWEARVWARRLAYSVLAAVVFQGILGGLRVVLVKLDLAIVHACVAQAFFCLTALVAIITSRRWIDPVGRGPKASADFAIDAQTRAPLRVAANFRTAATLAAIAVTVIYLQLIAGAIMRHYQAGLAIPDLPLAYGHILPPTSASALHQINEQRLLDPLLDRVTLAQIWIHFAHRIGAVLVTIALTLLITHILRRHRQVPSLRIPALLLIVLLIGQITLGVLVVLMRKPADIASLHVAVGALTLVTTFTLLVQAIHLRKLQPQFNAGRLASEVECSTPSLLPGVPA